MSNANRKISASGLRSWTKQEEIKESTNLKLFLYKILPVKNGQLAQDYSFLMWFNNFLRSLETCVIFFARIAFLCLKYFEVIVFLIIYITLV